MEKNAGTLRSAILSEPLFRGHRFAFVALSQQVYPGIIYCSSRPQSDIITHNPNQC